MNEIDIEKFIELRVSGVSFDNISKEINVSKPTLIKWSRDYSIEINNRISLFVDELRQKYRSHKEDRIKHLSLTLEKMRVEIESRNFSDIPTDKLLKCYQEKIVELEKEFEVNFLTDDILSNSLITLESWKV